MKRIITIAAALLVTAFTLASAQDNDYQRSQGFITRVGIEDPAGFILGAGYQFSPHFALAAEAYSFSGLTSMSGALDARYYILDKTWTPYVGVKGGYGVLGTDFENQKVFGAIGTATAGVSYKGFDLGVGAIYDNFHKGEYGVSFSWTLHF